MSTTTECHVHRRTPSSSRFYLRAIWNGACLAIGTKPNKNLTHLVNRPCNYFHDGKNCRKDYFLQGKEFQNQNLVCASLGLNPLSDPSPWPRAWTDTWNELGLHHGCFFYAHSPSFYLDGQDSRIDAVVPKSIQCGKRRGCSAPVRFCTWLNSMGPSKAGIIRSESKRFKHTIPCAGQVD